MISTSINSSNYFNVLAPQYSISSAKQPVVSEVTLGNIVPAALAIAVVGKTQMDAYQKQWEEAIPAIAQLRNGSQNIAQVQKAAAAEEVHRIKDEIKILMMMRWIGDPKAIARLIAQLAWELASAAHEYASAGGGGTPQESTALADTKAANSGASDTSSNSNQNNSVAADVSAAASGAPTVTGTSDVKELNETFDAASTVPTGAALAAGPRQYLDNLKQQSNADLQNDIAGLQQQSSSADADSEFVKEVRNLASQLKALAKQQVKHVPQAGGQTADVEIANADQAINEVEKIAFSIVVSSMQVSSSVNIFA
jgi:hypothetical protein